MWFQMSKEELEMTASLLEMQPHDSTAQRELKADLSARIAERVTTEVDPEKKARFKAFIEAAQVNGAFLRDGDIDWDDEPMVAASEEGAYVLAWIWASNEDAGFCRTCGADYPKGGDGFDGECPDCADKTEAVRLAEEGED